MRRNHFLLLVAILVFSYAIRVWRIATPSEYYFDEVYHAFTAQYYATNDPKAYEWWHQAPEGTAFEWLHPPLAKLFQGASIAVLGNNSFAWRFPSAVFGTLVIGAVYLFARRLSESEEIGLLAAFLASIDGLLLSLSRIAMNDIFVSFFMIMSFLAYWQYYQATTPKKKYLWMLASGVGAGLSFASKWSGLFVLGVYFVFEIYTYLQDKKQNILKKILGVSTAFLFLPGLFLVLFAKNFSDITTPAGSEITPWLFTIVVLEVLVSLIFLSWKKTLSLSLHFVVIPIVIYLLSFGQFWLQQRDRSNIEVFRDLHHQIWWYQTNLEATHPWQSQPFEWFFNLKPVWFYVKYNQETVANIYALANPIIAWGGIAAIAWMIFTAFQTKNIRYAYLLLCYATIWIPWSFSPRIMFFYHYTPAMALLTIITAICLHSFLQGNLFTRRIAKTFIVLAAVCFVYFYPHWTGLEVPKKINQTYYWLPSWKP